MDPYVLANLSEDPHLIRVLQDMVDRINVTQIETERLRERDIFVLPEDAARKQNPIEGIISIPYRNDGGQDGQIRVSKDGVIVSYVNPAESLFPYIDLTTVNSVGASSTLHTFSLPPGVLAEDGDVLQIIYGGTSAANDNDKIVNASFGGTAYVTGGALDIDGGGAGLGWRIMATISRLTSTSVRTNHSITWNALFADSANAVNTFASSGLILTRWSDITGLSNLNTTAQVMSVTGVGVANADVVQNLSIIEYLRPKTRKLV